MRLLSYKTMIPTNLPQDINIELLLSYFEEGTCKVSLNGSHKRNTYNDLIELSENADSSFKLTIGRRSLYHSLPEYMFHPIDRFENLAELNEKEEFQNALNAEEKEKENAHRFFAPLDIMLLQLRMDIRERLSVYTDTNKVIIDMLGDRMSQKQKDNRFIRQLLPLLPLCRNIRGNKTLLSIVLRKVFLEEDLHIETEIINEEYVDTNPRYQEHFSNDTDELYLGNTFDELTTTYIIHFWSDNECDEHFLHFIDEVEELRLFIQDYFLALGEQLCFKIVKDDEPLRLSDPVNFNYLNYNTNL